MVNHVSPKPDTLSESDSTGFGINHVENVWQFMRENWLSNRIFSSCDNVVDHCCHAWNKLTDQPWHIMSIGLRQWGHGS